MKIHIEELCIAYFRQTDERLGTDNIAIMNMIKKYIFLFISSSLILKVKIILFCIIAVLILLFIITLFFGLTDTKEKDEMKKKQKEEEKDLFFKIDDTVKLDIPKEDESSNDFEYLESITKKLSDKIEKISENNDI